jgi:hypothetical protein
MEMTAETNHSKDQQGQRLTVVFQPEDIRLRRHTPQEGLTLKVHIPERGFVYTSGRLEWAIEHGYRVFVVTPQCELRDEDGWWVNILTSETDGQVLLGLPGKEALKKGDRGHIHHWIELFSHLGIPSDDLVTDGDFLQRLKQSGVTIGGEIRP